MACWNVLAVLIMHTVIVNVLWQIPHRHENESLAFGLESRVCR